MLGRGGWLRPAPGALVELLVESFPERLHERSCRCERDEQSAGGRARHGHIAQGWLLPVPRSAYGFGLGIFKLPSLNVATNSATFTAASRGVSKRPGSDRL
eukprot:1720396-Prymnesium_polylepis.1